MTCISMAKAPRGLLALTIVWIATFRSSDIVGADIVNGFTTPPATIAMDPTGSDRLWPRCRSNDGSTLPISNGLRYSAVQRAL